MSNNQFEMEFEESEKAESYYVDQAMSNNVHVFSAFTPHGIRGIDSEYCELIKNIHSEVKQLYTINRRREKLISTRNGQEYEGDYKTYYDPISLNDNYGDVRVEWDNGVVYDFKMDVKPIFDLKTKKTNPEQLRKDIQDNPHLHVKIKENLIENLDNYLKIID